MLFNISSLYIKHFILSVLFYFVGFSFFIAFICLAFKSFKLADTPLKNVLTAMIILIFIVPILYSFGGVMFSWYLLPSSLFVYFLILFGLIMLAGQLPVRWLKAAIFIGWFIILCLVAGQLLVDVYGGAVNYYYYSDVGRYIKSISSSNDSVMLKPLGVIPFFAERYIHDEAGLASPLVTDYWEKYGSQWCIYYIKDQKPTFIVDRFYILQDKTIGSCPLSVAAEKWLNDNYLLVKEFHYNPADYQSVGFINKFISNIFKTGAHNNFYIFKKI